MIHLDSGKFYKTAEFKRLQSEWADKLAQSGFSDIEDQKERLKGYDRRTIAFENRERIESFFRKLDAFLLREELPDIHRKILELYSAGVRNEGQNGIAQQVGLHFVTVHGIIKKYKILLLKY